MDYSRLRALASRAPQANDNPFTAGGKFSTNGGLQALIGGGYGAGAFSPNGNPAYLTALQRFLQAQRDARVQKAGTAAALYAPDDPMAAQRARIDAATAGDSDYTTSLAAARAQVGQQQTGEYWDLLRMYAQPTLAKRQKQPSALPGVVGTLGAAAIGAL